MLEVLKEVGYSCNCKQGRISMILKNIARLGFVAIFIATPAYATKTVTSPYVTKGKATIEWRGGYEMDGDDDESFRTRNQFSYGFTDFYDLKISADTRKDEGEDTEFTDIDFENKFQLLPKGEYFIDLGLRLDYTRSLNGGADEIGTKILMAKKTGELSHILNLEAGREIGEDSSDDWAYGLSYGASYPLSDTLALGGEWYSDFGDFEEDYSDQDHRVGPVFYGTAFDKVKYQFGVLAGVSDGAPDATLKATANYSFEF